MLCTLEQVSSKGIETKSGLYKDFIFFLLASKMHSINCQLSFCGHPIKSTSLVFDLNFGIEITIEIPSRQNGIYPSTIGIIRYL